jgi:hypothetical protein
MSKQVMVFAIDMAVWRPRRAPGLLGALFFLQGLAS